MTGAGKAVDSSPQAGGCGAGTLGQNRTLPLLCVFLSFFAFATLRAPVPAVNEPHYLAKAKHYWNPAWCQGDLFLESANAHLVFYQTFGWPTLWLTLEQTAWLGRFAAMMVLSIGWCRLVGGLLPGRWSSLWTAWGFLFLAACGNLSGEWVVGGVESKVVAYGLLFWSLGFLLDRSWNRAALCAGLAVSFHPVVGMWGLMVAAGAEMISRLTRRRSERLLLTEARAVPSRIAAIGIPMLLLVAAALPGLLPALSIVGADSYDADFIQVYYRLAHHLDPMQFAAWAWAGYTGLLAFWCVGRVWTGRSISERWFAWFVLVTVLIAVAGLAVGFRTGAPKDLSNFALRMEFLELAQRMKFLKLYPFRLCDVMIPLAAAITAVGLLAKWQARARESQTGPSAAGSCWGWVIFGGAMITALLLPAPDRNASRMEPERLADWLDVCHWVSQNTPADAVVYTEPQESWAFKWYAERAEFVSFKDCPQDAAAIVAWNNRLLALQEWAARTYDTGSYSADALGELYEKHGITHVLARRLGPVNIEPIYRNETFRVYSLRETSPNGINEAKRR